MLSQWLSTTDSAIFRKNTLPLELSDQIIDFVAGLKVKKLRAHLATCSLVCRAWTSRSRYHFFQNCRLLVHLNNTLLFGQLLRSPLCTILLHLETLTLRNNGESSFHRIQDDLKLLTNLKSLRLCGWNWNAHGSPPPREFLSTFTNVVDLEIDCKELGDFDHMVQTFCAIPSTTRLAIRTVRKPKMFCGYRCTPPRPFVPRDPLLATPPQLLSLLLDTPAIIPIVHWLNGAGSHCITTLEISLPLLGAEDLPPLQQFIRGLNASLEHFTLDAYHKDSELSQGDFERTFEFSTFQRLRTCRFNKLFPALSMYSQTRPLDSAIPSIVRSIASPLQTLTFEIEGLPCRPWDTLDSFLSQQPGLKSVIFEFTVNNKRNGCDLLAARDIEKAFPRIGSMGILDIRLDRKHDKSSVRAGKIW
ncbi:hypothetical protein MVEN_00820800 [Mycena venus]|uniref:F-box domain-containing protein n=1 Tax=Mycena venus TaxID=2733690 RepID=A0A8H6YEY9_9AGAR|nr:hypothetical protein MVEN_00820800 [Mycena venus]